MNHVLCSHKAAVYSISLALRGRALCISPVLHDDDTHYEHLFVVVDESLDDLDHVSVLLHVICRVALQLARLGPPQDIWSEQRGQVDRVHFVALLLWSKQKEHMITLDSLQCIKLNGYFAYMSRTKDEHQCSRIFKDYFPGLISVKRLQSRHLHYDTIDST